MPLTRRILFAILVWLVLAAGASAQQVVFVVRHAERADEGMQSPKGSDPPLSAAGAARAKQLASMLRAAGVTRVFATQFKRTQQTAEPLATAEHLKVSILNDDEVDALVQQLAQGEGAALVVGHSSTVGNIVEALGVKEKVKIPDDEYDNLFIVVRRGDEATLVTLKF